MATFNKLNAFPLDCTNGVHNFSTAQLQIALTNTTPAATNAVLTDLTEVSYTNLSSRVVTTTSNTQTSGTQKLICADLTLTASGAVATFRYVYLYNNTATNKNLIGYWDYGTTVTMASAETFLIDFDGTNGVLQIA